jgi:hypothetical protein
MEAVPPAMAEGGEVGAMREASHHRENSAPGGKGEDEKRARRRRVGRLSLPFFSLSLSLLSLSLTDLDAPLQDGDGPASPVPIIAAGRVVGELRAEVEGGVGGRRRERR